MSQLESVTEAQFEESVLGREGLTLVDFWASWCGPCLMLAPKLEEIQEEMGEGIKVVKLNIEENPGIAQQYRVMNIPFMMLLKNGEKVDQLVGNLPKKDIVAMIERHR